MVQKRTRKKKILSAAVLIGSAYASVLFTIGLLLGYFVTSFIYHKYLAKGPLKEIFVNVGKWKIHLHHWISGGAIILLLIAFGWQYEAHKILLGILCGIVAEDIYDFNNWHQIVVKKQATSSL